jgi:hypothetical protein
VTTWHVYPEGLKVWHDGKLVAVISQDLFPDLIEQMAKAISIKSRTDMYS